MKKLLLIIPLLIFVSCDEIKNLIFSEDNVSQYQNVLQELGENPDSRRANMIYTRPHIWLDYYIDGMNDFICTNSVQYFIRDKK